MGKRRAVLSHEEQAELVNEWLRRHDPVAWLRRMRPAVYEMAVNIGVDADDILSACMAGVMCAAKTFDPNGGANLSTYCILPMESLVKTEIRKHRPGGLIWGAGGSKVSRPLKTKPPLQLGQCDAEKILDAVPNRPELDGEVKRKKRKPQRRATDGGQTVGR